jgi:hypothetical protein
MTIPFQTTPEQVLHLAEVMVEMTTAGLDHGFIVRASELGRTDQGVFDVMALWPDAGEDANERDEIVADIQESLDDYRRLNVAEIDLTAVDPGIQEEP